MILAACEHEPPSDQPVVESISREETIRTELERMADDFLNYREMQGFDHEMSLLEAYRWQDEMAAIMRPVLGRVVGYKAGGHDSGPGFATFPPEGIRGLILAGMMRPSGTVIRPDQFRRGFLEADFAFRVGNESINNAQTDLEMLAGLDAIIPFAEIPDPFYGVSSRSVNGTIVANMASRMSFTGEPLLISPSPEWLQRINNMTFAVLDENNKEVQAGRIEGWYEPMAVVRWLRNQLKASGIELKPGDLLSLGNVGIIRQLHEGSPRGPAYQSDQFRLEYYGLTDGEPPSVIINIERE